MRDASGSVAEQQRDVLEPGAVGAGAVAGGRAGRVDLEQEVALLDAEGQQRVEERDQALLRRRAGAEWGRAAQQVVLEGALGVVDQRLGEALAVAEAVEDRALGDARLARDVAHRHRGHAVGGEQAAGGVEHAAAVAGRVGALRARSALDGELGHDCSIT